MRLYSDEQVARFERDGWWTGATWVDQFRARVAEFGDRVSLVDPINREAITDGPPRRLTWHEVDDEVERLARALYRAGVRADDVVGVQLPNTVELAMTYIATATLGAIACPFPIQYAAHELRLMGGMAGLTTFVTTTRANRSRPAQTAIGLVGEIPTLGRVLAWGDDQPDGVLDLGAELADDRDHSGFRQYVDNLQRHPNDCVTLCWTSG
ncbi:MAG: AMP-binding protein, partial [Actinobacteria bacterium]|nr:AMP-binding protein [Actinomycetota bacterium]